MLYVGPICDAKGCETPSASTQQAAASKVSPKMSEQSIGNAIRNSRRAKHLLKCALQCPSISPPRQRTAWGCFGCCRVLPPPPAGKTPLYPWAVPCDPPDALLCPGVHHVSHDHVQSLQLQRPPAHPQEPPAPRLPRVRGELPAGQLRSAPEGRLPALLPQSGLQVGPRPREQPRACSGFHVEDGERPLPFSPLVLGARLRVNLSLYPFSVSHPFNTGGISLILGPPGHCFISWLAALGPHSLSLLLVMSCLSPAPTSTGCS